MDYNLTPEQRKAALKVRAAILKAGKLGVGFWDDYGAITAFNANVINCPLPDSGEPMNDDYVERMYVDNFHGADADDPLFVTYK